METPKGFERATGVIEGRRHCVACKKDYPVRNSDAESVCPYCGDDQTQPLAVGSDKPVGQQERPRRV